MIYTPCYILLLSILLKHKSKLNVFKLKNRLQVEIQLILTDGDKNNLQEVIPEDDTVRGRCYVHNTDTTGEDPQQEDIIQECEDFMPHVEDLKVTNDQPKGQVKNYNVIAYVQLIVLL